MLNGVMEPIEICVEACNTQEAFDWCKQHMPGQWNRLWEIRGFSSDFCRTEVAIVHNIAVCKQLASPMRFYFHAFNTEEKILVSKLAVIFRLRFEAEVAAFFHPAV